MDTKTHNETSMVLVNVHTYRQAKLKLRPLGLESKDDYLEVAAKLTLPLNPEVTYKDDWQGWDDYLTTLRSIGKQRTLSESDKKVNAWLSGHLPPKVESSAEKNS